MENKSPEELEAEQKLADQKQAEDNEKAPKSDAAKITSLEKQVKSLHKQVGEYRGMVSKLAQQVDLLLKGSAENATDAKLIPKDTFEVDGQKYQFRMAGAMIPNVGKRTALEILTDDTSYEKLGGNTIKGWLAANKSKMIVEVE